MHPMSSLAVCHTSQSATLSLFTDVIKQKGLENVTVDDLVAEITPTGRGEPFYFHVLLAG